jgi:hypothetical protein
MSNTSENPTKFLLAIPCVGCDQFFYVPLPLDEEDFAHHLVNANWHLSVLTPENHGRRVPAVIGAQCPECASETYSPEALKASMEARTKIVLH